MSGMEYGTVTGRLVAAVADAPDDAEALPEIIALSGTVTFTPSVKSLLVASEGITVLPAPIVATLDTSGYVALNGAQGVTVLATNSTLTNPTGWTYQVTFSNLSANGQRVTYDSFSIQVPAGQTVDLSKIAPVSSSGGVSIVRGDKGDAGPSAYQAWLSLGNTGTVAQFLEAYRGPQGTPGVANDSSVAALVASSSSATRSALVTFGTGQYQPRARRMVYFGDSWGTQLYSGVTPLPDATAARIGATLVKNYAVSGAIIGPTVQNSGNATDAQIATAQADSSYDKSTITDVVVLAGVNNIGGYLPTVDQARGHFQGVANLYPNARLWFATNAKKAINNAGDNDPWRWYNRFFEGASLAGYAVAEFSPMWTWGALRTTESWWDAATTTDSSRHPTAVGFAAVAGRLAGFLTGESWRPYFKVATTLHPNAQALMTAQGVSGTATLATDDSTVEGSTLRLNVSIGGMDALASVATTAYQPILQIPTGYIPIGNYLLGPAGCRLSSGTMDFTYALRVNGDGVGVVSVDARLLNNHVGYFVLRADLPLNMVKTAD